MKIKFIKILIIFAIFSLYNCDSDKYFGYENTGQDLLNSTIFKGRITHFYTSRPVTNAIINIGSQETSTDTNGFYMLKYIFSDDELRNKPVKIYVHAADYYEDSLNVLVELVENEYNFQLKYAPPIILEAKRRFYPPTNMFQINFICQAIVKDYQGWEDIDSVFAFFKTPTNQISYQIPMNFIKYVDIYTAYYQLNYHGDINLSVQYSIIAKDKSGFNSSQNYVNDPNILDYLLFDPNSQ